MTVATIIGWSTFIVLSAAPPAIDSGPWDAQRVIELEQRRVEMIVRVSPAVVCIYDEARRGGGSGVIIHPDGFGLTNYHVVSGMMKTRRGLGGISDGNVYELEVLGVDPTGDVAMFRLRGKAVFDYADLGDSDQVAVGDRVIAAGNPFVLTEDETPSISMGIITGVHRYQEGQGNALVYTDCLQTDAAVNPGNSGGPLFDMAGRVIGINGRISASMFGRGRLNVGMGYAITINQIKRFLPGLRAGLLMQHGTMQATVNGALLFDNVMQGGPAWSAGIRPGDRLIAFDGIKIRSANHYGSVLGVYPADWTVSVSYARDDDERAVPVQLEPLGDFSAGQAPVALLDMTALRQAQSWDVPDLRCAAVEGEWAPEGAGLAEAIDAATKRTVKLYGLGVGLQEGYGSGILVSADGKVLTVLSILLDADVIRAVNGNGERFAAKVIERDNERQLALLQLTQPDGTAVVGPMPAFTSGTTESLAAGHWVIGAGNAFKVAEGAENVSAALGVLSGWTDLDARRRRRDFSYHGRVMLFDAITANPGSPGGPVVDAKGAWVGMIGRVVTSNVTHTRLNYAIPVETCLAFIHRATASADVATSGAGEMPVAGDAKTGVTMRELGFRLFDVAYRKNLAFVDRVTTGSPADVAGLRADDLIIGAANRSVPDAQALRKLLARHRVDEPLQLVVLRDDEHISIAIETAADGGMQTEDVERPPVAPDPVPSRASSRIADMAASDSWSVEELAFELAARTIAPHVVRVETIGGAQPFDATGRDADEDEDAPRTFRDTAGSAFRVADGPTTGIIYSDDGYILTSSFNFVREPAHITVQLHDERRFVATLVGRDQVRKLALLKIDATQLPVPQWAPRDQVHVGQWAIANGRALGRGDAPHVSVGIVSGVNRMLGNAIQIDAKLSPVNYGGPLVDVRGRVLGICVPMAQRPGELAGIELYDGGVGFAVPGWRVEEIAAELKRGRTFYRGWLGMQMEPREPDRVRIAAVADPSPLRNADVRAGDIIVQANGMDVGHFGQLIKAIYMLPAGENVDLTVEREGASRDLQVRLARADELGPLPEIETPFDPSQPLPDAEEPAEPMP